MIDQWSLVNYKIDHQRKSVEALNFIVTQPTNALTLRCDSKKTLLRDCGKFMWQFHSSRDAHKRSQEGIFCALWVVHFMVGFGWVRGSDLAPEEKRRRRNFLDCIQLPFHGTKLRDSSWSSGSHSLLSLRLNVGSQNWFRSRFLLCGSSSEILKLLMSFLAIISSPCTSLETSSTSVEWRNEKLDGAGIIY